MQQNHKELLLAKTEQEIEAYFTKHNIETIEDKIKIISSITHSSNIHFFYTVNDTPEMRYKSLLTIFLDPEFRYLKGLFYEK